MAMLLTSPFTNLMRASRNLLAAQIVTMRELKMLVKGPEAKKTSRMKKGSYPTT